MIAIEVFAAKDIGGRLKGIMLTVPVDCGLQHADALRLIGRRVVALRQRSILPIDLPEFDDEAIGYLREAVQAGGKIAVAEFTALGLANSYVLSLEDGSDAGAGAR
jgi:hypothetical protein